MPLGLRAFSSTRVSSSLHPANISHPGHFQPAFPRSLICFIRVCICLFSAAVPWSGGAGDAAAPGKSSRRHRQELENQGKCCEGCGICSLTPTLGCLALQTCRHTHAPHGTGSPGGLEPQVLFYRKKPQFLVCQTCCLLVQLEGSCSIKPTAIHKATVDVCECTKLGNWTCFVSRTFI